MKIKTLYTCEICNTSYSDEKKALECERNHKLLKDAEIKAEYSPISSDRTGVPKHIKVKFKGQDNWITYKR